ncbi:MAG: MFS transporter [Atopobiaceae bacterium]|nr:MFS transporter [Atopobiaceae bacterium]
MEKKHLDIRYVVVAVAVCLMACGTMGLPNAYGVFYTPMSDALGAGRGAVTMHMSISNLVIGLFTPIVARSLAHGHKMRNVLMVATALVLVSGVVIAFAPNTLIMDVAAVVRGVGFAAVAMFIITLYIGNWFQKGRGTITGIALSGSGIGSAIASPIVTACIQNFGYQVAYLGFVAFTVITILPVMLFCPLTPEEVGLKPYGADEVDENPEDNKATAPASEDLGLKLVLLSPTFIVLVVFVIAIVLITTLSGHMASLAQDYGYSAQVGALLLSASMVGNVVSKFALGAIADRIGAFRACVISLVTTLVGLLLILFNFGGQAALLASGFLYGTCFSIGSLGISLLTRYIFGDDQYADAYSTISLVTSVASALGVVAAGLAYDVTGSYVAPIIAGIVLVGVAGGCLAYLRWRVTTRPWEKRVRA